MSHQRDRIDRAAVRLLERLISRTSNGNVQTRGQVIACLEEFLVSDEGATYVSETTRRAVGVA